LRCQRVQRCFKSIVKRDNIGYCKAAFMPCFFLYVSMIKAKVRLTLTQMFCQSWHKWLIVQSLSCSLIQGIGQGSEDGWKCWFAQSGRIYVVFDKMYIDYPRCFTVSDHAITVEV